MLGCALAGAGSSLSPRCVWRSWQDHFRVRSEDIIEDVQRFKAPSPLPPSIDERRCVSCHAGQDYDAANDCTTKGNWSEIHSDYYERESYVIGAVLYLGEKEGGPGLIGGETAFLDIPPKVCCCPQCDAPAAWGAGSSRVGPIGRAVRTLK